MSASYVTPWTVVHQAPLSMGISRQEYWSGLPCPHPGIFSTQGLNPGLPHCRWILYHLSHQGSPRILEWVAYSFSRGSSHPGIKCRSPSLQADFLLSEAPGKYKNFYCLTLWTSPGAGQRGPRGEFDSVLVPKEPSGWQLPRR